MGGLVLHAPPPYSVILGYLCLLDLLNLLSLLYLGYQRYSPNLFFFIYGFQKIHIETKISKYEKRVLPSVILKFCSYAKEVFL